jgi:hypothetical protein
VRREWEPEQLIACWSPVEDDWRLVGNKHQAKEPQRAQLDREAEPVLGAAWAEHEVAVDVVAAGRAVPRD